MSDALDHLTRGLTQASGLSLTTRGLLLEASEASPGELFGAVDASGISDVAMLLDPVEFHGDFALDRGQLVLDHGLKTAVILSLFTDRLAEADDSIPTGDGDRRGVWFDSFPTVAGDLWGSRLWLLGREKKTQETRLRAEEYTNEALAWLVDDGVAEKLTVDAEWLAGTYKGFLGLAITIQRPRLANAFFRFAIAWEAL